MNSRSRIHKKKRRRRRRKLLLSIIPLLILPLIVYGSYLTYKFVNAASNVSDELNREKSDLREESIDPSKDNFTVLFLGVDTDNPDEPSRTDSIMLATFNKEDKSIKLLSIPRDSRVPIVGLGYEDKINHAHSFGGVEMTIDTIENLLNIPIDYYVKLNFTSFITIIDILDGVEVDVPFTFTEHGSQGSRNKQTIEEGIQVLDGEQALAYARMRKQDPRGDIGRGERQQQIIKGMINEAAKLSSITRYGAIIDELGDNISTNFLIGNLVSLHQYASSISEIESLSLEGDNLILSGIYYYQLIPESVATVSAELRRHLNPSIEQPAHENEQYGEYGEYNQQDSYDPNNQYNNYEQVDRYNQYNEQQQEQVDPYSQYNEQQQVDPYNQYNEHEQVEQPLQQPY